LARIGDFLHLTSIKGLASSIPFSSCFAISRFFRCLLVITRHELNVHSRFSLHSAYGPHSWILPVKPSSRQRQHFQSTRNLRFGIPRYCLHSHWTSQRAGYKSGLHNRPITSRCSGVSDLTILQFNKGSSHHGTHTGEEYPHICLDLVWSLCAGIEEGANSVRVEKVRLDCLSSFTVVDGLSMRFQVSMLDQGPWSMVSSTFLLKASLQCASSPQQKQSSGPLLLYFVATVVVPSPDLKASSSLSFPGIANRESQIEHRKSENRVITAMPRLS